MAPKLPKRLLESQDLRTPQKLLEVLNPISESLSGALDKGLTLGNLRHVLVTAEVTPPDEWVPLTLLDGATSYNPQYGVPAARWTPSGTEYRGLVVTSGPNQGAPFARLATSQARLSAPHVAILPAVADDYASAAVEVWPDGSLYYSNGPVGWLSLWSVRHPCAAEPPLWAKPVDVTLQPETQQDWGKPSVVLVVGATRDDRVPCLPEALPAWEAPLLTEGRGKRRVLRIQRVGGLVPGVRHRVTLLALYE